MHSLPKRMMIGVAMASLGMGLTGCKEPSAKVLASGWADSTFESDHYLPNGSLKDPITYVFSRGVFYPGHGEDSAFEAVPFQTICDTLRPHLAAAGYILIADPLEADLAIVVNWGMTWVDEENVFYSDEDENATVSTQRRESELRNARLLGVQDLSLKLTPFRDDEKLRRLASENYFFVLLGFDMQQVKNQQWEPSPLKFVTKYSLPINRGSFAEVLPVLSQAGAAHVGRKTADSFTRIPVSVGDVEMGELEEVETGGKAPE